MEAGELRQQHQDPVRRAQAHVAPGRVERRALEQHAPVLRAGAGDAQPLHLCPDHGLQAEPCLRKLDRGAGAAPTTEEEVTLSPPARRCMELSSTGAIAMNPKRRSL